MKKKKYTLTGAVSTVAIAVIGTSFMMPALATDDSVAGRLIHDNVYSLNESGYASNAIDPNFWVQLGAGVKPSEHGGVYPTAVKKDSVTVGDKVFNKGDGNYEALSLLLYYLGFYENLNDSQSASIINSAINTLVSGVDSDNEVVNQLVNSAKEQRGPYRLGYDLGFIDPKNADDFGRYEISHLTILRNDGKEFAVNEIPNLINAESPKISYMASRTNKPEIRMEVLRNGDYSPSDDLVEMNENSYLSLNGEICEEDMNGVDIMSSLPSSEIFASENILRAGVAIEVVEHKDSPCVDKKDLNKELKLKSLLTKSGNDEILAQSDERTFILSFSAQNLVPGKKYELHLRISDVIDAADAHGERSFFFTPESESYDGEFEIELDKRVKSGLDVLPSLISENSPNRSAPSISIFRESSVVTSTDITIAGQAENDQILILEGEENPSRVLSFLTTQENGTIVLVKHEIYSDNVKISETEFYEVQETGKTDLILENLNSYLNKTLKVKTVISADGRLVGDKWEEFNILVKSVSIDEYTESLKKEEENILENKKKIEESKKAESNNKTPDEAQSLQDKKTDNNTDAQKTDQLTPSNGDIAQSSAHKTNSQSGKTDSAQSVAAKKSPLASTGATAGIIGAVAAILAIAGGAFMFARKRQ